MLAVKGPDDSYNGRTYCFGKLRPRPLQPNQGAIAAALRARSLDLRWELALRVLSCFSFLLLSLSLRLPMNNSFQYFYQICHAVPGFMANESFSILLQPVYNK